MSQPSSGPVTRVGGRYRLVERIGVGAMGAVWRATDELLNRTVAVKELLTVSAPHTDDGADALEESRQRILREGRIGARLRHAHLISMFDVVVHDDRPWLVMEYLPSESLAGKLATGGVLEPARVADIGRQVADGLAAAHAAGVVHRDVKPGNVLIADTGQVKLTDFGVSRAVDEVQLTRTGLIAGTPAFLSPEVARGQDPTPASDVFALGATLYAAVEGRPPFGLDDNAYALLHRVATGQVQPPERAGPLGPVIMWLLGPDPADRPNAIQARDALEAVAAGRVPPDVPAVPAPSRPPGRPSPVPRRAAPPISPTATDLPAAAPPPAPVPTADRSGGRRRTPLLVAALVLLALVGGITAVVLTRGSGGSPAAAPPSVAQPSVVPSSAAPTATADPAVPSNSPSPSPSASPQPPATTPEPAPAAPIASTDPAGFVQSYYALLPGNTDAAFAMLSSAAQAQSRGRAGYDGFYGTLSSVSLQDVRRTGADTAEATVVFVRRDGSSSRERYSFQVVTGADGRTVMESFRRA